jgi:hypothetical protein
MWKDEYHGLRRYIDEHEISITPYLEVPKELRTHFYEMVDSILETFLDEECSDLIDFLARFQEVFIPEEEKITFSCIPSSRKPLHHSFSYYDRGSWGKLRKRFNKNLVDLEFLSNNLHDITTLENHIEKTTLDPKRGSTPVMRVMYKSIGKGYKAERLYIDIDEFMLTHDPARFLKGVIDEPFWDLMNGELDIEGFMKTAIHDIQSKTKRVFDASYRKWVTMIFLSEMKVSQFYTISSNREEGKEYLKQSGMVKFNKENVPKPIENDEIDMVHPVIPFVVSFCNIVGYSAEHDSFYGIQTFNDIPQEQFADLVTERERILYGKAAPYLLNQPVLIYKSHSMGDVVAVSDHDGHWLPDILFYVGDDIPERISLNANDVAEYLGKIPKKVIFVPPTPFRSDAADDPLDFECLHCGFDSEPVRNIAKAFILPDALRVR